MPCLSHASNGAGSGLFNCFAVTHKPFADALAVAAQDVALPVAALLFQVAIEGVHSSRTGEAAS